MGYKRIVKLDTKDAALEFAEDLVSGLIEAVSYKKISGSLSFDKAYAIIDANDAIEIIQQIFKGQRFYITW